MTYKNYKLDTVTALGVIAQNWFAKPPAKIDIAVNYTTTSRVMNCASVSGSVTNKINVLDQVFVKNIGVFVNFADGLLWDDDTDFYATIGYTTDGATYVDGGAVNLRVRIAAFNTMFPANRFLPGKSFVAAGDNLRLLGSLNAAGAAAAKLGTGSINPDLADTGASAAGEMPLRFDIVAEIEHSYEVTT